MRAWRFSWARLVSRLGELSAHRLRVGVHHRLDRQLHGGDAEGLGEGVGVALGLGRGVAGGHDRGADGLRAQGVGGQARHQRGVDPAGDAEDDVLEAVLEHVVAQPQHERVVDLGLLGRQRLGQGRAPAARLEPDAGEGRGGSWITSARLRRAAGRWEASRRRAAAAACEVDVAQQQLLAELGRAGDRGAGVVEHAGVAVEDELVLAADEPAEGDVGDVVAGALGEHPLALAALADVVGGGGDVDDQGGPGEGLVAGRRAGLPDVLADRQPERGRRPGRCTAPAEPAWK